MTKLSALIGDTSSLRVKEFELGSAKFKVKVPISAEMEQIEAKVKDIDAAYFDQRYKKVVDGMDGQGEEVDGDLVIDGRSTKELVRSVIQAERRILEFFKLLVPADGQSTADLTYADIEEELPFSVQMEMLAAIGEAIQPSFKDARKN